MALSVYVHIPYCLQRCHYCDFTTFEYSTVKPPDQYVQEVLQEIRNRHAFWPQREIATLYFGGGTPSLLDPALIVAIKNELANVGFAFLAGCEITLEINPATLTESKLEAYLSCGINRFSVGAQTFSDELLKLCQRKHSAQDTRDTLNLLKRFVADCNYSFDLLFALPGQSLNQLKLDLEEVAHFSPPHLSAYCLTVPETHPMARGRAPEGEQLEMFFTIEEQLKHLGLEKYEISNFAKPGLESRHNGAYWKDQSFWGLGLSSHSYKREAGPMGLRFWNPKTWKEYSFQVESQGNGFEDVLPAEQYERLQLHEALTDFCHTFLRTMDGLPENALRYKFGDQAWNQEVLPRLEKLTHTGLLKVQSDRWTLTRQGELISNKVFEELTFLAFDRPLTPVSLNP